VFPGLLLACYALHKVRVFSNLVHLGLYLHLGLLVSDDCAVKLPGLLASHKVVFHSLSYGFGLYVVLFGSGWGFQLIWFHFEYPFISLGPDVHGCGN
jgi:hypothetical protein